MKKPTETGLNRTGVKASPIDSKKTMEGAMDSNLVDEGDDSLLIAERTRWSDEAEPVGTMPTPGTLKGAVKTVAQKALGKEPNVFIDKLGERLAFERTGVRLYEALLCKLPAAELHRGGPTRDDLEQIRDQELEHFFLLKEAIETVGGDPTTMTPCADMTAVASSGIQKVLADARSTLTQCLDAMLIVELADNDSWLMLAELADGLGKTDMAESFRRALADEDDHLAKVRSWVSSAVRGQAGVAPTPPQPQPSQ